MLGVLRKIVDIFPWGTHNFSILSVGGLGRADLLLAHKLISISYPSSLPPSDWFRTSVKSRNFTVTLARGGERSIVPSGVVKRGDVSPDLQRAISPLDRGNSLRMEPAEKKNRDQRPKTSFMTCM